MGSPRYEREIRSLLEGLDDFLPDEPSRRRRLVPPEGAPAAGSPRGSGAMHAVLPGAVVWILRYPFYAAVLFLVVGRFLLAPLPEIGQIATLFCGVAASFLLILVVFRAFNRVRYGVPYERVWRGEVLEGPSSRISQILSTWWNRLGGRR